MLCAHRREVKRRRMHNELMDAKGTIRTFVRLRPPLKSEVSNERVRVATDDLDRTVVVETSRDRVRPPPPGLLIFRVPVLSTKTGA